MSDQQHNIQNMFHLKNKEKQDIQNQQNKQQQFNQSIDQYQKFDSSLQADFNLLKLPDEYLKVINQQISSTDEELNIANKLKNQQIIQNDKKDVQSQQNFEAIKQFYIKQQNEQEKSVELTTEEIFIQTQNSQIMSLFKNKHQQSQKTQKLKKNLKGKKLIDSLNVNSEKHQKNNQFKQNNNYENNIMLHKLSPYQQHKQSFYNQNKNNISQEQFSLQSLILPQDEQRPQEIQQVLNKFDSHCWRNNIDKLIKDLYDVTENYIYNKIQDLNKKLPIGQKKQYKPNDINKYKKLIQMILPPSKEQYYSYVHQGQTQNRILNKSDIQNTQNPVYEQNSNNTQIIQQLSEYQQQFLNDKQTQSYQQNNPINQQVREKQQGCSQIKLAHNDQLQITNYPKNQYEKGMKDYIQEIKRFDDILKQKQM